MDKEELTIEERIGTLVKRNGRLYYNSDAGRVDILFDDGDTYGGLHCGESFDAMINGEWAPVSIEMGNDWYIPRHKGLKLPGLIVRK